MPATLPKTTDIADIVIRRPREAECADVSAILQGYARERILLWRTPHDIRLNRERFRVAVRGETIVGCVALRDYGDGLAEVRSLAVVRAHHGKGIGAQLVADCVEIARGVGAHTLFALTKQVQFFERCGFRHVSKTEFPQKVWADCKYCYKRDLCDETAMKFPLAPPSERTPPQAGDSEHTAMSQDGRPPAAD